MKYYGGTVVMDEFGLHGIDGGIARLHYGWYGNNLWMEYGNTVLSREYDT